MTLSDAGTISRQSCAASTGLRCDGGSFSRPRSLYGNVSMASRLPTYLQEICIQWRVSQVVLVYGLHRPEVWSCRECWCQPVSGALASTVPQCGIVCGLLCATAVFQWTCYMLYAAAEDLSLWTVIARHQAPLWRFVILAPSINVMTYLLT